jgi:conjugal transfer mating pair stabilization protein TraG
MYDYTIHAFFNADMIVGVLNAVVMLVGSGGTGGDYLNLIRVAAMLGIFVAMAMGFAKARGEDAAQYMIMVALFYSALLVPRVTVTVEDHGSGGGGYGAGTTTVANVPLGLAFFASTTSKIGYWLTNTAETFYTLPSSNLRLGEGGMMAGSRALRESAGASIVDPILAQDMTSFMRDCINPEIVTSPLLMSNVLRSKDLLADFSTLGLINAGRMVTLAGSGLNDCGQAYIALKALLAPEATNALQRIAKTMSPGITDAQALTYMTALLPASEGLIMTASGSAADAIKQRMMVNVLNETGKTIGQLMNDPSAVQAGLGEAIATQSANTSYRVMARMAQESLPVIRNAVELVIMGVFPIMLIIIIIAGSKGGAVLKSYVMMMLWVQLWAPIYAIINYIGTMQSAKSQKASLAGIDGVAIENAAALLNTTLSGEAVAGLLCISVPMIALALIKGGEMAATGMVTSLMSPGSSAAQSAGAQAGTGNVSMGNTSWGNYSANNSGSNKTDNSFGYTSPDRAQVTTAYGSAVGSGADGAWTSGKANRSNLAEVSFDTGVKAGASSSSGTDAGLTKGMDTGKTNSVGGGYTQSNVADASRLLTGALAKQNGGTSNWTSGVGNTSSTETGSAAEAGFATKALETMSIGSGVKVAANTKTPKEPSNQSPQNNIPAVDAASGAAASGAAASGAPASRFDRIKNGVANAVESASKAVNLAAGASHGLDTRTTEGKEAVASEKTSAAEKEAASNEFKKVDSAVDSLMATNTDQGTKNALNAIRGEAARRVDAKYDTSLSSKITDKASTGVSRDNSVGVSMSADHSNEVFGNVLAQNGGNVDAALRDGHNNTPNVETSARAVATGLAAKNVSAGGPANGLGGDIAPVKETPQELNSRGNGAVQKEKEGNFSEASREAEGYRAEATSHQHSSPNSGPDTSPAKEQFDATKAAQVGGASGLQSSQAVKGGINRMTSSTFMNDTGMVRLLGNTYLGGALKSGDTQQIRQDLQELAASSPVAQKTLSDIGTTGKVTEADAKTIGQEMESMKSSRTPLGRSSGNQTSALGVPESW